MSDAAAALAAPMSITHKGKEYALSPLNMDMIAMFERWLENRAFETIELRKGSVSEDDYQRLLSVWVEQCVAGKFRWGSAVAISASRTTTGMKFLLFLHLAEKNPDVSPAIAEAIFDEQVSEIRSKMEVVNASPFAENPADPTEPTPMNAPPYAS